MARWRITRTWASDTPRKLADVRTGLLVVEGHDDHRAIAFVEALDASGELLAVETRHPRFGRRQQIGAEPLQQLLLASNAAAQVEHRHPARAKHERDQPVRLAQASRSQGFERGDEHLLCQVLGRMGVSQMPQAIEPDAGRHPSAQLGLGLTVVSRGDAADQIHVGEFKVHRHVFYVRRGGICYTCRHRTVG